jgi:hypothetical protein
MNEASGAVPLLKIGSEFEVTFERDGAQRAARRRGYPTQ